MDILPEAIGIPSYHEQRFAVRFQSDHAIDDVGPGFLELPGPANIGASSKRARNSTKAVTCLPLLAASISALTMGEPPLVR
jgi:hypothetical protein